MNDEEFFNFIIDSVKKVYISVYGLEKWESMNDEQKHNTTMAIIKDFYKIVA